MGMKLCPTCRAKKIDVNSAQCKTCFQKNAPEPVADKILRIVRRNPDGITPLAISESLDGVSAGKVLDELIAMHKAGKNLHTYGDRWSQSATPETGGIYDGKPLVSDAAGWHLFGACGDSHLGSKQERLDALRDLYRVYEANGIKTVLHTGNYIDGESRFNKHELKIHGLDAQLAYMGEVYPEVKGMRTLMVSGDDHEGWYAQREGVDIGRYMQSVMQRGGRKDIVNLGYMECFVPLQHKTTGKRTMCHVIHPGGGTAYAISYTTQKQIESYEGGEKPAITLIGHYHKAEHLELRNIHAFQTGCTQDQTVFMRKKKLIAQIGGWIIMVKQNPETGAVEEIVSYFKAYYNQGYYQNQRWSLSGPVTQVPRLKV